jgi:GT2 family glycosyltransferase
MERPAVDVVVPFAGSEADLRRLRAALGGLRLHPADTLTIVDNRPGGSETDTSEVIVRAPERQSSYFARNRGAARGHAPWIVFVDADLEVAPDLVDRYFDAPPGAGTALLIGRIETVLATPTPVARYGVLRRHLSNESVSKPGWEYGQTANAAVRRDAFVAVGGFVEHVRSGGDADLAFRLRASGYGSERRMGAVVRHPPRSTLGAMLRQFARYGSGAQWLHDRYPEFAPPRRFPALVWWLAKAGPKATLVALRGDADGALVAALDPLVYVVTELGRLLPNERGAGRAATARHVMRVLRQRRRGR